MLEAALRKAKIQAAVPPVEDQIAMSVKFLERTELQAAVKKKSQCEQEIAEAEADLARMREEHSASGEEPKTEVQQLRARVAQLEEIRGRHVRGSEEVAEHIRTKAGKRRVGGCAEDVLPSTEQDLACWLDDRQTQLPDALDMADAITSLITRGLAKMASFVPPPSALSNMVP